MLLRIHRDISMKLEYPTTRSNAWRITIFPQIQSIHLKTSLANIYLAAFSHLVNVVFRFPSLHFSTLLVLPVLPRNRRKELTVGFPLLLLLLAGGNTAEPDSIENCTLWHPLPINSCFSELGFQFGANICCTGCLSVRWCLIPLVPVPIN